MCEVTIVIPNYKGKEYLFSCVKSLYEKDQTEKKILIIDNASNDGSIEEVVKEYPEVECVMLDKNYGFCRAVNIGIEKTDTAYVILLNNDTVIKDNYVKYLLDSIKKDPNIFSVEPKMIQYHDPSKIDSAGTYYNALGWAYAYGKDKSVKKYNNIRKIFAACGGYAQVVPMEDLNLHFTGDFHAITSANNLLAAMLDNSIQQGNELNIDPNQVVWKRCVDINDRVLRNIVVGLGRKVDGTVREDHFVITVASEIMAILCLATDYADLKERLGKIIVAYTYDGEPVTAKDVKAVGSMAV